MEKKAWYQSKAIWVAILQASLAIVVIFTDSFPEWAGGLLLAKSVLDVVLRTVTTTQIQG